MTVDPVLHALEGDCRQRIFETTAVLKAAFDPGDTLTPQAGSVLKLEGENSGAVYFASSGWLAVSKSTADGGRLIVDVVLPGEMLDPGFTAPEASLVEIEALTCSVVLSVRSSDWFPRLARQPGLAAAVERERQASFARRVGRMPRLGKGSAAARIACGLFELCVRSTAASGDGAYATHIPMNQQQLGDFCGLSSVHVRQTIRRLARDGAIEGAGRFGVTIRSPNALAEIAGICPDTLRQDIVPVV